MIRRCIQCNKTLPADYAGEKCSLCAIGLIPSPGEKDPGPEFQYQHVVEGRQLSGVQCPSCNAELTLADLGYRGCAICGTRFSVERAEMLMREARMKSAHFSLVTHYNETTLGDRAWPEDAPLR